MEERYWKQFEKTGRIDDYLTYRGMQICDQVMERGEGREKREPDNRNRYGAAMRTNR